MKNLFQIHRKDFQITNLFRIYLGVSLRTKYNDGPVPKILKMTLLKAVKYFFFEVIKSRKPLHSTAHGDCNLYPMNIASAQDHIQNLAPNFHTCGKTLLSVQNFQFQVPRFISILNINYKVGVVQISVK